MKGPEQFWAWGEINSREQPEWGTGLKRKCLGGLQVKPSMYMAVRMAHILGCINQSRSRELGTLLYSEIRH